MYTIVSPSVFQASILAFFALGLNLLVEAAPAFAGKVEADVFVLNR